MSRYWPPIRPAFCLGALLLLANAAKGQLANVSISPSSGSSASGATQTFVATYSDSAGATDINQADLLIGNGTGSAVSSCYLAWVPAGLYLANDAATGWIGPVTPGSSGIAQNGQCTLNGFGSSISLVGSQAVLTVKLSFSATFAGSHYMQMQVYGAGYAVWTALQVMGTWTVNAAGYPDLTISKGHTGNFIQGQTGNYTISVSNSGSAPTSGQVTVTDTLPTGMTTNAMSGSGWSCTPSTATCTRSDSLAAGGSYPAISLTVNVASNAASSLINTASVSGGGETNTSNDSFSDATTINTSGGSGSDLALGKAATQSSTYPDTPAPAASMAVDGNTDGNYFDRSVSTTNYDQNAWWQVDLGSSVALNSVVIWNRTDCCNPPRLADYWVFASNTPFQASDTPSTLSGRSGTWSNHQTTSPSPSTTLSPGGYPGRYVRVQLSGQNYLSLAEVQVFGTA